MFVDLTVAVQVGVVASALLFVKRMAEVTSIEGVTTEIRDGDPTEDPNEISQIGKRHRWDTVRSLRASMFTQSTDPSSSVAPANSTTFSVRLATPPKALILRMRDVPAIDATGIHALEQMVKKCRSHGTTVILTEMRSQPLRAVVRAGKLERFGGRQNLAKSLDVALERAREIVGG